MQAQLWDWEAHLKATGLAIHTVLPATRRKWKRPS